MLAAVSKPDNDNLVLDSNYPVTAFKVGQVLLKVSACGVCRSDVQLLTGVSIDTRTYALGHEICGVPVELGEGVDHPAIIKKNQLYSVLAFTFCTHGLVGSPAILNGTGVGLDGGYAEYVTVNVEQLVEMIGLPSGLSPELAAIAADAGITAYNAVHNTAGIKKGTNFSVLIFGIGGLGHLSVQYAKHFGATDEPLEVYACDIKPAARKLAVELGAVEAYNLIELNQKIANGFKVDITIDFFGTNETFNSALQVLSNNDTKLPSIPKAVLALTPLLFQSGVGINTETLTATLLTLFSANIHVLTSVYGSRSALVAALDLFAKGIVQARVQAVPLRDINNAIDKHSVMYY
ncbi:GroES-like protein [Mycena floridula]|nr:GroES-like protein [Mycena floridula]